jgi:Tol biopolymer transport system component
MSRATRKQLVGLIAVCVLAGCNDDQQRRAEPRGGASVTAPPQATAQIAAVRLRPRLGKPSFALLVMNDDGSRSRVVVRAPREGIERLDAPEWSPDGRRLYFIGVLGEREGDRFVYYESDVFVVDADGGEPRRVTTSGDVRAAVPSPDGKTLLLERDEHPGERPFTAGLWLTDGDGGNARRLVEVDEGRLDLDPSWSPDGRSIAFARCTFAPPGPRGLLENACAVYTVSAGGSMLRKLADRSSQPAFSPHGRRIAFVSDRDEQGLLARGEDEEGFANELYVMDADGGEQKRVTRSDGLDESAPAWSPDGSRIAFAREGPARFAKQLMVVKADGSCPTALLGDAGDRRVSTPWFFSPTWRPGRLTGKLAPLACKRG